MLLELMLYVWFTFVLNTLVGTLEVLSLLKMACRNIFSLFRLCFEYTGTLGYCTYKFAFIVFCHTLTYTVLNVFHFQGVRIHARTATNMKTYLLVSPIYAVNFIWPSPAWIPLFQIVWFVSCLHKCTHQLFNSYFLKYSFIECQQSDAQICYKSVKSKSNKNHPEWLQKQDDLLIRLKYTG